MVSCHCYIWLPFGRFWWVSDHPPVLAHSQGLDMTVSLGGIHGRWSSCSEFCGGQKVANTSNSLKSPWDHWHIWLEHVILHLWETIDCVLRPSKHPWKWANVPNSWVRISFFSEVGGCWVDNTRIALSFGVNGLTGAPDGRNPGPRSGGRTAMQGCAPNQGISSDLMGLNCFFHSV